MIDAVAGAASRRVITNKDGRDGGGGRRNGVGEYAVFVKQRVLEEIQTNIPDGSRAFT